MMTVRELSKTEYQEAYNQAAYVSFTQDPHMADLLQKRGYQVVYLGLEEGKDIRVAGIVYSMPMTGGLHMEMNVGPFHQGQEYLPAFYQGLQAYAKEKGALELIVKPYDDYQTFDYKGQATSEPSPELIEMFTSLGYLHDGLHTGYPGGEPDWLFVKELEGVTEESLLQSYLPKGRTQTKKTAQFGIQLKVLERDELPLFKAITASTSDRRDYMDKSLSYYQDFFDAFGENAEFVIASLRMTDYRARIEEEKAALIEQLEKLDDSHRDKPDSKKYKRVRTEVLERLNAIEKRLAEAQELVESYGDEEVVLAGSLFVYTPHETVYLFSGSYTEFNRFYAPVLLQEYAMKEAIKRGISFYNFLGIQGVFDGSDGVMRFKQQFNGHIVRKMGTFRYYPKPWKFKLLSGLKKLLRRA